VIPHFLAVSAVAVAVVCASSCAVGQGALAIRDLRSDTWVATDALGRTLPSAHECGHPRKDRTVGVFYFLWHGEHIGGGPFDITKILATNPGAMDEPANPLWGPLGSFHHWGEPLLGYYLTDDEAVLRKHAQMLVDAGVDVVIFDVTNQFTYARWYTVLLRVWGAMRAQGNHTPQIAFLTPFWDPARVVNALYRDLYEPGLASDLWFCWDGKPLILADPAKLGADVTIGDTNEAVHLERGHTLGLSFTAEYPFDHVSSSFPTWRTSDGALTLALYRSGPGGTRVLTRRFDRVEDGASLALKAETALPAGVYYLEASSAHGTVGWWSHRTKGAVGAQAYADRVPVPGSRSLRIAYANERSARIRSFFTFRAPQPDYFRGPTAPDMWSWLEVYPQHVFRNARGQKEQMAVGVAQNAVGGRLGSMSEPGARGRSYRDGATDTRPNAVRYGLNFAEQFDRALREDPRFIFITGWNEWIAGRYGEFAGVKRPVMFVDQFDEEHSRDIEPMRGGHGDDYYYQMVSCIRRYKGVRSIPPVKPAPITIDGRFDDWRAVQPEYRDTVGDPVKRNHRGWDPKVMYANTTGRNDIVTAKVSWDAAGVSFYVSTREPMTPPTDPNWMVLLIDADANASTGWLGYDFAVNRTRAGSLERNAGGFKWEPSGEVQWRYAGRELELTISWRDLGCGKPPAMLDFKWADNCLQAGDWTDFTLNGDAAPNDRFNYRAVLTKGR
jgi:hypothetical protein